ncbi:MAG: hypothetical protein JJV89_04460 [Desulfosarcina sp.]|nr:hypothetical protein [Desulfobacterales bacterium]
MYIFLCKGRLYKFLFFLFFIYFIDFSCFAIIPSAAADGAEPDKIQITADSLNINNEENYAEFIGAVKALHKDMTIDSDRLKIYYDKKPENSGASAQGEESIKKIIAESNVTIVSEGRIANAERAEYMTKTGVLILTGKDARITNDKNSITGAKITFNRSLGNVKVVGDPSKRVKATFFADKKSSEFNILKSSKDDLNKAVVKDVSTQEPASDMAATQVAGSDVIQDKVVEEPAFDESGEPDPEQAATLKVTEESDEIEIEGLADNNNPTMLAASTVPDHEIRTAPEIEEADVIKVESLVDNNNDPTILAALTVPDHEIKTAPAVEAIGDPALISEEINIGNLKNKIGIIFIDQKEALGVNDYNIVLNDCLMKISSKKFNDIILLKLSKDNYPSVNNIFPVNGVSPLDNSDLVKDNYPSINNIFPKNEASPFDNIGLLKNNYPPVNNIFFENEASPLDDHIGLLKISREMGLNAIVIATIADIFTDNETRGILWFKNDYNVLIIKAIVDIYDTETGTKIFYENFTRKCDIDKATLERLASKKIIDNNLLTKQLQGIAKEAVARFNDALTAQHWTGFLKSTNKNNIIISSGRTTGLTPGNVLEVYNTKTIKGYQGRNFLLPADKIGLLQLTEVSPETSKAVLVAGTKIEEGCLLKPRQPVNKK